MSTMVDCFDFCSVVLSLVHGCPGWQILLLLQRVWQLQCCFVVVYFFDANTTGFIGDAAFKVEDEVQRAG